MLTLPSGEQLPLRVDLPTLDASPHGHGGETTIYCTTCHTGTTGRYRYPHAPNPAQTHAELGASIAPVCESCHYPHQPFHDADTMTGVMPTCVDCHGNHDIARVETVGDVMPTRCVTCHTDQTTAWAADFVAPRPGMGVGAAGYAGSARCTGCHDDLYLSWHDTLHARIIQDPADDPQAIVADFDVEDPDLTFSRDDVQYVIGNRRRQVFLTESSVLTESTDLTDTVANESELVLLPAQWTVATGAWEPLYSNGDGTPGEPWLASCAGCHVTGLDVATGGFTEFGVGCESCHGPSAAHAEDPLHVKPFAAVDEQVCGACHSRGESPDGHPYPTTYRPGEALADHFTFTQDESAVWADGSAQRNHQQYMDWRLGSTMEQAQNTSCTTCHRVHERGDTDAQLLQSVNALCLSCHNEQRALVSHTPFHEKAVKQRDFQCTDCHMPKLASGAQPFDLHIHSLLQPDPQGTVDHGGLETMPNACNTCHTDRSETPQWAAQMVSYALVRATPSASKFFGPGPTPTSPPPPTPIASVGQRAEFDLTPPGWWIRWLAYGVVGLAGIWGLVYLVRLVRPRRNVDA